MRKTVQRAYVVTDQGAQRTLVDSEGRIYLDKNWVPNAGEVIAVPGRYERWCDVPEVWIGHLPYWGSR